ncbi:MAG: hypothetical protein LBC89_00965 [Bacteroidales bacterium]|nr:hypothetical protein [Bacteroidales bacterium]
MRRVHEALYKSPHLQDWMRKEKAIRVAGTGSHIWVSRPRSWYNWVMLDSKRNEIITNLCKNHSFTAETHITGDAVSIDYFFGKSVTV